VGFWGFRNKICQTVGDGIIFCPPHIILGVDKQRDLGNKICQTVGARDKKIKNAWCLYLAPYNLTAMYTPFLI
jgi:hypothetical protein